MLALALIAAAFGAGSIPFGVLVARRRGVEIREHGSGNIGATNVARVLGPKAGAVVLILDALKGTVPTLVAIALFGRDAHAVVALTGAAAILGHCFSPLLGGRGGKGVATAFGVFGALWPPLVAIALVTFLVILRATRVPALGSLAGAVAVTAALVVRGVPAYAALGCATTALLVFTHRSNLAKLRSRLR